MKKLLVYKRRMNANVLWNVKLNETNQHAHVPIPPVADGESVAIVSSTILPVGKYRVVSFRRMPKRHTTGHLNTLPDSLRTRRFRRTPIYTVPHQKICRFGWSKNAHNDQFVMLSGVCTNAQFFINHFSRVHAILLHTYY